MNRTKLTEILSLKNAINNAKRLTDEFRNEYDFEVEQKSESEIIYDRFEEYAMHNSELNYLKTLEDIIYIVNDNSEKSKLYRIKKLISKMNSDNEILIEKGSNIN